MCKECSGVLSLLSNLMPNAMLKSGNNAFKPLASLHLFVSVLVINVKPLGDAFFFFLPNLTSDRSLNVFSVGLSSCWLY